MQQRHSAAQEISSPAQSFAYFFDIAFRCVLQALAAEKEAIAHEKEMEVARLRAMQEKQADRQSEQDELRARRYQVGQRTWLVLYTVRHYASLWPINAVETAGSALYVPSKHAPLVRTMPYNGVTTVSGHQQAAGLTY